MRRRPFERLSWRGTDPDKKDTLSYRIEIGRDTLFEDIRLTIQSTRKSTVTLSEFANYREQLKTDSVYFWRVQATDLQGEFSAWSVRGSFFYDPKDDLASAPTIVTPTFGAYTVLTDAIVWNNSTDADDSLIMYNIDVSPDSGFSIIVATRDSISQKSLRTSVVLSSFTGIDSLRKNTFYYLRIFPQSRVDTMWVPGYSSAAWEIWYGDTALAGDPSISGVTVITPIANKKNNEKANIAWSADSAVSIVFPDSAVTEPVVAKVSFVPIAGTVGYADSTLPATTDPQIVQLQKVVTGANQFAIGDPQTYYVREGAYVIELHPLSSPDSIARLQDTVLFQIVYSDTNNDGRVDGEPRVPVSDLHVFLLNERTGRWEITSSTLQQGSKSIATGSAKVMARSGIPMRKNALNLLTPHFSTYSILAYKEMSEPFGQFKVYPSPYRISAGGAPANIEYRLNEDADIEIRIFSKTGGLVWSKSIRAGTSGGIGGPDPTVVAWDGRNDFGRWVGNSIYLVKIMAKPKKSGGTYYKQQYLGVVK
jgi:hypothetical protein